ncbi:hypothetical protein BHE74_00059688 [Ensete ventricosum]|nr:hypothetical protein BHE74_00059688 [Ensete ventricosum]
MRPQVEVSALPVSGRPYDRWRIDITYVRSTVQPLGIWPYLCQVGRTTAGVSTLPVPGRPYDRWGFGLTCARLVVRLLAPSYLCPTSFLRWVGHVNRPVVRRSDDVATGSLRHVVHLTARTTEATTKYDGMVSNKHSKDLRYGCPVTITIKALLPLRSRGIAKLTTN